MTCAAATATLRSAAVALTLATVALLAAALRVPALPGKTAPIIGGSYARPREFPSQVHVRIATPEDVYYCGGTVISESWVLTAGHCIVKNASLLVHAGFSCRWNFKEYPVERSIVHDNFTTLDDNSTMNDIALIEVAEPIEMDSFNQIAMLPQQDQEPPDEMGVIVGFGRMSYKPKVMNFPMYLRKLDVHLVPCPVNETNIICSNSTEGTGPCEGDSGSALFVNGTIFGVISLGYVPDWMDVSNVTCDDPLVLTVYTSVAKFRNWIRDRTGL